MASTRSRRTIVWLAITALAVAGLSFAVWSLVGNRHSSDSAEAVPSGTDSTAGADSAASQPQAIPQSGDNQNDSSGVPSSTETPVIAHPNIPIANGRKCTIAAGAQKRQFWPAGSTWWPIQNGVDVPYAPSSVGPQYLTTSGVPYCYAHSPVGAAFAAMATFGGLLNSQTINDTLRLHITGAKLPSIKAKNQQQYIDLKFLGFQVGAHDDSSAVISLAMAAAGQKSFAGTFQMRWVNGDWRAYVNPDDQDSFWTLADQQSFVDYQLIPGLAMQTFGGS